MYTPERKVFQRNEEFHTPEESLSFSRELRQVLQERNILTGKTCTLVCSMLDNSANDFSMGTPSYADRNRRKNFRKFAIDEIISSERAYLEQLELLMKFFVNPLKERAIISDVTHMAIFGQIEMIHNLNKELLDELERNQDYVAQAFLKMAPFFKLYAVFAFDFKNALFLIQEQTSKNPVFRKFLEQTESRPEVQKKLNSLMIIPIQRVPRYKLLLEQVLLYTSPADGDFKQLKDAIKQVESTASHINSCIADQEVTQKLINLQNSLVHRTPNIVKPSRKVIKEGVLNKVTRTGTEIKRYCILMSDIFMYCKILKEREPDTVVENSLECCCIFPLKKCKVNELFPGNFKVACQGDGIILGTSNVQLGRTWVAFIRDAIDLHIECRKTLRKESSKRKPIRRKEMKNFDTDYILSPNKKKYDYETVYRARNSDTEDETKDEQSSSCFPFMQKAKPSPVEQDKSSPVVMRRGRKRPAPPPPSADSVLESIESNNNDNSAENRISKLYKFITSKNEKCIRSILKRPSSTQQQMSNNQTANVAQSDVADHDPTYGFANRYSDTKSYFRTHNVDTIPTSIKAEDFKLPENETDGKLYDVLFPLRSSGNSNKSYKNTTTGLFGQNKTIQEQVDTQCAPPQKKRVKFEQYMEPQDISIQLPLTTTTNRSSLREKIYDFFANLF